MNAASAIALNFHLTSPLPANTLNAVITSNQGSLTIDDRISNLNVGESAVVFSTLSLNNRLGNITGGTISILRIGNSWMFQNMNQWVQLGELARTGISWSMNISCSVNLINCAAAPGSFFARFGFFEFFPASYDGGMIVDSVSLTPTPTPTQNPAPTHNSTPVPEASSIPALLLLSGVELLRRKFKVLDVMG